MTEASLTLRRCGQCYHFKPVDVFVGTRGQPVKQMCASCRVAYGGWSNKTLTEKLAARPVRERAEPTGRIFWNPRNRKNKKLGGIASSTSEPGTCPPSCGLYEAGCYASYGKLGAFWRSVGDRGITWDEFLDRVRALPAGSLWRHNVAGDLVGDGTRIDRDALAELVSANRGRCGFTFTHYPYTCGPDIDTVMSNEAALIYANARGFTVNVSCDTLEDADNVMSVSRFGDDGVPVVVILARDAPVRLRTPRGFRVTICPAETTEGVTCASCQLCANPRRKTIIGFRAHGQFAKHVPELIQLRRRDA